MNYLSSLAMIVAGVLLLLACGDKSPKSSIVTSSEIKKFQHPTLLEGTVSTGKTTIKTGKIEATDVHGLPLSQTEVENGHFRLEIKAETNLPIILNFSSNHYPDKLLTVAIDPSITKYFIDPSTTSIAQAAKAMGGYTRANMVRAAEVTTHSPDANKTTTGWRGDPTTQYGGWH